MLAVSLDDRLLYTADGDPAAVTAFELRNDTDDPVLLHQLPVSASESWETPWYWYSSLFAAPRTTVQGVDVFGRGAATSIEWYSEMTAIVQSDYISYYQRDRFNNEIPRFELREATASPDGSHIYLRSRDHEILIFERVGNGEQARGDG